MSETVPSGTTHGPSPPELEHEGSPGAPVPGGRAVVPLPVERRAGASPLVRPRSTANAPRSTGARLCWEQSSARQSSGAERDGGRFSQPTDGAPGDPPQELRIGRQPLPLRPRLATVGDGPFALLRHLAEPHLSPGKAVIRTFTLFKLRQPTLNSGPLDASQIAPAAFQAPSKR